MAGKNLHAGGVRSSLLVDDNLITVFVEPFEQGRDDPGQFWFIRFGNDSSVFRGVGRVGHSEIGIVQKSG